MGSSNSRFESTPASAPVRARSSFKRRLLSSLFCASSASRSPIDFDRQMQEHHPAESSIRSPQNSSSCCDVSVSFSQQSSLTSALGTHSSGFTAQSGTSTGSSNDIIEDASVRHTFSNISGNYELMNVNDGVLDASAPGTHFKGQPISADAPGTSLVVRDTHNLHSVIDSTGDASRDTYTSDSGSSVPGSLIASQPLPRFLLSVGQQGPTGIGLLLVDVVSIHSNILSSNIAEISNRDATRNTRRMFWDAFSRNSSRPNTDNQTIVFTTSHADDLGSHDRWLLDYSGDLHYDGIARESRYTSTRTIRRGRRGWQSRYEMSERFHDVHDERGWQSSLCTTGLHPRGSCSCESSFVSEESSGRANVSQIIMLADALFEVLEEIHRHRMSVSLSTVTHPAPEAVVNSFPLKNHRSCGTESGTHDVQQCHICLVDYEEGDEIRVLPCSHEYHMSCVDKWLKEIHGVCPLCREDVCKGVVES